MTLEWTTTQAALMQQETQLTASTWTRKAQCRYLIQDMKVLRREMKDMAVTIQERIDTLQALERKMATASETSTRTAYTNRIMDITKQVSKQKQAIHCVLEDIKAIQTASETLKRSEAVTKDKLYTNAQKHVTVIKGGENVHVESYRKFAHVRQLFEALLVVIGDTGATDKTARELETWITQLRSRDNSVHLERVLADLHSVPSNYGHYNQYTILLQDDHHSRC